MMMYLERENLLSREQEKDVLDIWKKSINEFPDVRLNLLIKYCNDNNCDFLAAKDLLYSYLQSDYTCVVDDSYYYFCSDVIMDNDFFLKDEKCQNKTNFEYILKNNPYRYGSVINNDFSEFDFDNFLYELLNDRIYIFFDKKLTSFKDEDEMVNVYFEYCSKIADLFLEDEYYDIKERKIDVSDIEKKMKFPIYIEKISREKIEDDLKFLDEDMDNFLYKTAQEDVELIIREIKERSVEIDKLEKEIEEKVININNYRYFMGCFSESGRLSMAFLYVAYKNNIIDFIFKDGYFLDEFGIIPISEKSFFTNLLDKIINHLDNDYKLLDEINVMSIIDEIDYKLTICQEPTLKEKNVIKIINDLYFTSKKLQTIKTDESENYLILSKICYDYDYLMSTEDGIEMYIYQMVNHVFEPFLHELLLLFKKHDIDIFAIQRKIGRYIIEDDEFEDYKSENLNSSLPKQIVKKTNHFYPSHTKDKVEKIYNEFINKSFIEQSTDINDFNYVFGHNNQLDKEFTPINWIVSQNLLAYFLNKTFSENDTNYLQIAYNAFRIKNKNINKNKMSSFMSKCRRGSESPPMYYKIIDELLT